MEMSHQAGAEAESLLRPDQRNAVVMPHGTRSIGWDVGDGEKAPFIRNEPVRLTPAWEGSNLPNDTLNLKDPLKTKSVVEVWQSQTQEGGGFIGSVKRALGIGMDLAPPKDRYKLIYMTLMLHGLGTLIGWNMFITAKDYFVKYKLVNAPFYADNFLVYVGYASQLPNFLFSWLNIFITIGGNLATRIVWSLCIEVAIFVFTVFLAMVDSSGWPVAFFWITVVSVFFMQAFNAIFQNSVYGVAARLPPSYTGAVVLGSNISGTLVVLLGWMSDAFGGSVRTSAIYYFIGGMFVLLTCFDTYFALPLNRFYRYHDTLQQRTNPAANQPQQKTPYLTIIKQCWVQLYNVFITFFVSLSIFPAMHSDIRSITPDFLGTNFVRITCFLTFNLSAMFGNITASLFQFPNRKWLVVFTTLRILFLPFFLLCNYHPQGRARTMPVLIKNDWVYWIMAIIMSWSSGHGSSLGMMYVGGNVAPEHSQKAGMLGGAMLVTGILTGLTFSGICPVIVTAEGWKTT